MLFHRARFVTNLILASLEWRGKRAFGRAGVLLAKTSDDDTIEQATWMLVLGLDAEGSVISSRRSTVAVLGASADRSKFGNKAVRAFRDAGWEVYPINPSLHEVEGIPAYASVLDVPAVQIDRVSFYVPPRVGLELMNEVAQKPVGEVWLNPGSESPELVARAKRFGLKVVQACSILAIGRQPSMY
jgi:predicted CoA-binding protein